jgi:hypothetical protein
MKRLTSLMMVKGKRRLIILMVVMFLVLKVCICGTFEMVLTCSAGVVLTGDVHSGVHCSDDWRRSEKKEEKGRSNHQSSLV